MFSKFKEKYIGDKAFYMYVLGIVVPMILQNLVTNFVSMLDNIMVGQIGTAEMSGVSIANQFIFVFNISVFGAVSGPSIFGAQFYGKGDHEGQKYSFRFRLMAVFLLIIVGMCVFRFLDTELVSLFLSKDDSPELIASTLNFGEQYMSIIIWSLIPFGVGQAYSSVVRECGETKIPMIGSFAAVGINLFLDYALIFGKLGFPEMGVKGAALATVIAKAVEAAVVVVWAHIKKEKNKYIVGLYKSLKIPGALAKDMLIKSFPLLINEFLWAAGMSVIAQCYSVRGIDVVAARNISGTVTNLFNVVFIQMGASIAIIVGQKLGAGDKKAARDSDNKLLFFSVVSTTAVALLMLPVAKFFPEIYKTEQVVKELSTYLIAISALAMPLWSYTNACYFTLRSGGKTGITFLFDFVYTWIIQIPLAFVLAYFTGMDFRLLFVVVTFSEILKVAAGYFMVKSDIWIQTIVD